MNKKPEVDLGSRIMNKQDMAKSLKTMGWKICSYQGDRFGRLELPDRTVELSYFIRKTGEGYRSSVTPSVGTKEFSKACRSLENDPDENNTSAIIVNMNMSINRLGIDLIEIPDIDAPEIFGHHIKALSDKAISWAKEQDLDKWLLKWANCLPSKLRGIGPLHHLGALALLGDVVKLKSYQKSFEAGDRLGFALYITKDYIDNALTFIEQNANHKNEIN